MSQEDRPATIEDVKKIVHEEQESKQTELLNRLDGKLDKIILIMLATLGSDIGLKEVHSSLLDVFLVGVGLFVVLFGIGFLFLFRYKIAFLLKTMLSTLGVIGTIMVLFVYTEAGESILLMATILTLIFMVQFLAYIWKLIPHRR